MNVPTVRHLICALCLVFMALPGSALCAADHAPGETDDTATPRVVHPFDGALLPRNLGALLVLWDDHPARSGPWQVRVRFADGGPPLETTSPVQRWEPSPAQWSAMRSRMAAGPATIQIAVEVGGQPRTSGPVSFSLSNDEVHAPILYQQMPLPIAHTLAHPEQMRWQVLNPAESGPASTVLEKQPVCGMCHHASTDGSMFVMDLDIGGDKGAFALAELDRDMRLDREDFRSWTGFQPDDRATLGLFPKLSPGGDYVLATVQERSMFVKLEDPEFSEFFFPLRGRLAYYSRRWDHFAFLPGADLPGFAQTGGVFSPDGREVVFSRARTSPEGLAAMGDAPTLTAPPGETIDDWNRRHPVRFDLYRVPFSRGEGGTPEPVAGASANNASNYWPRFTPDGRFIIFTQAPSGMMNQPGSMLMIVPAGGGTARELACSLPRHNSWHSVSPDGRWLVFSSKALGPNTRIYLAHLDHSGHSAPPVLLHKAAAPHLATVLPEFVNTAPGGLVNIAVGFDAREAVAP